MQRVTFPVGPLQCNCSILYDADAADATVVDPGGDVQKILAFLAQQKLKLRQIVVTHAHLDHIAGAVLLSEATGAPIVYHQADVFQLSWMEQQAAWMGVETPQVRPPDTSAEEGSRLWVGSEAGEVIHTLPVTRKAAFRCIFLQPACSSRETRCSAEASVAPTCPVEINE